MTRWMRDYHARREALIEKLGNKCVKCGSIKKLQIDHINGRDYKLEKLSSHQRARRYEIEASEGKLQVLCKRCNVKKG